MTDLPEIARALLAPGKGILAADESVHTADERLRLYGINPSASMRRADRELFLDAPGIENYLSGVILFTETLVQTEEKGELFPASLAERGILPGIKVDLGLDPYPDSPDEFITKGLVGLAERLKEFAERGAKFTKWRAAIVIDGDRLPTAAAIHENAKRLASYAREVQQAGLVPIIEPEVLLTGKHSRSRARDVIKDIVGVTFSLMAETAVDPKSVILKTAMAISGKDSGVADSPEEVAADTLDALTASVPRDCAGIVFLSGGQSADQATANLAAITKKAKADHAPWPLTFSYARALQDEALTIWQGKPENISAARAAYIARLQKVTAALAA
jgi:fructose-bisphosphate aldolase class I